MKMKTFLLAALCGALVTGRGRAESVPEPGLLLYGVVRNLDGRADVRMTTGNLVCRITPPAGSPLVVTGALQNLNDQFSYALTVPFATSLGGPVSSNALALTTTAATYLVEFTIGGVGPKAASTNAFTFSSAERGSAKRLDMDAFVSAPDSNSNDLPDWWEQRYPTTANPSADTDGDGMKNLDEYRSGTNPTNAASVFAFISVSSDAQPGLLLQWASQSNRCYSVLRASDLLGPYVPLHTNLPATPPINFFRDSNAALGQAFYRLISLP